MLCNTYFVTILWFCTFFTGLMVKFLCLTGRKFFIKKRNQCYCSPQLGFFPKESEKSLFCPPPPKKGHFFTINRSFLMPDIYLFEVLADMFLNKDNFSIGGKPLAKETDKAERRLWRLNASYRNKMSKSNIFLYV